MTELQIVTIQEECSFFTPGAYWSYGTESYVVDIHFAMPPEVAARFDELSEEELDVYLMHPTARPDAQEEEAEE